MPLIPRTCCYVCSAIPCMHCHVCPITLCVTCDFMYALRVCPAILLSGILSDSICVQFGMPCHSMSAVKLYVCPVMVCSVTSHMPCHGVLCNFMLLCHVCPVTCAAGPSCSTRHSCCCCCCGSHTSLSHFTLTDKEYPDCKSGYSHRLETKYLL